MPTRKGNNSDQRRGEDTTEGSCDEQLRNADVVRRIFDASVSEIQQASSALFSPNVRIFMDSNPGDSVVWEQNKGHVGLEALKTMTEAYSSKGFSYDIQIHDIYTCGPVVVVSRTDTRKEKGQPDKPIPAVGVFAIKDGKVVEWSDYYR
jgi:limonene-1,2-epoxide hydrolase